MFFSVFNVFNVLLNFHWIICARSYQRVTTAGQAAYMLQVEIESRANDGLHHRI